MSINTDTARSRDMAGITVASLFILIAVIALWDTTQMIDPDSYVFPRVIAIAMIVFCILLIITNLLRPANVASPPVKNASTPRRISLVIILLINCALMPWSGFLLSGVITFILLIIVAMYDEWTLKRKLIYPLVAVGIVTCFYLLFTQLLLVPLPTGSLFD